MTRHSLALTVLAFVVAGFVVVSTIAQALTFMDGSGPTDASTSISPHAESGVAGDRSQATDIPPGALTRELEIFVGDSRVLAAKTRRIVVGNGKVVSVSPVSATHVVMIAEEMGETVVHLWLSDGSVHSMMVKVTSRALGRVLAEVESLLQGAERVSARVVGERIVLEGSAVDTASRERAAAVAALYPEQVVDLVGRLGWEDMVHVDVRIVEFRRGGLQELGIRWQDETNGPTAGVIADWATNDRFRSLPENSLIPETAFDPVPGRTSMRGYLGITSVLDSRIRLLEQSGEASLVAAPRLSCRSGGAARFVAGGEIPVPVINSVGATDVEYREYGVILDVKPIADPSGSIFVKVETELSQVDDAQRVAGVPGLLKRRSSTDLNVLSGQTVVIAGLINHRRSQDTGGLPVVSRAPLFGRLFGVKGHRHEETELVIFLTPRIEASPDSWRDDPMTQKAFRRSEEVVKPKIFDQPPTSSQLTSATPESQPDAPRIKRWRRVP